MKISLITTQNVNNYGAILQAFALQKILSRYGDVEVINYDNRHIGISFDLIRFKPTVHGLLGMGKDIFRIVPRYKVIKKFKAFIQKNMLLTKSFSSEELLSGELEHYDLYVAGSDQIWNPVCISKDNVIDPIYFLSFAPKESRKISYASSIGGYKFSANEEAQVTGLLEDFNAISVREKDTQILLNDFLNKDVEHVLDPTLLLSKKEWLEAFSIEVKGGEKEGYILLYTVPKIPLIRDTVDYFAKKTGLKVVTLDQGLSAGAKVDLHIRDAGPIDFLELFANAAFVITDSFHGTCFSINLEKPFAVLALGNHSNRIESLLTLIGLEGHLIKSAADFDKVNLEESFSTATANLTRERKRSLGFIEKGLTLSG